ncbi:hypothetical protein AHAS_AhasUnG0037100 [Arachis hypogaea]
MNHLLGFVIVPDSINTTSLPQKHLPSSFFSFIFFELEELLRLPKFASELNLCGDIAGVMSYLWVRLNFTNISFWGSTSQVLQGYTHLHLGAVRLVITLHGKRSLPVITKVALLDTTFKDYQYALIGALATLHHQVFYKVQDHALDLNLPNTIGEALFMFTDNARGPAIVNILRIITTEELSSIIPLEWITDYKKAFPKE